MTPLVIAAVSAATTAVTALLIGRWQAGQRRLEAAGAAFARRNAAARREARPSAAEIQCLWEAGCDQERAVDDPYCPRHIALMCGRAVAA